MHQCLLFTVPEEVSSKINMEENLIVFFKNFDIVLICIKKNHYFCFTLADIEKKVKKKKKKISHQDNINLHDTCSCKSSTVNN